jgi:hypothetical protein
MHIYVNITLYLYIVILRYMCIFYHGATVLVGQGVLFIEDSWSHSDTPHLVGLLWTSGHPVAKTCTWQHTTLTRDRHPCHRRDSNPRSQQASGRRPTPETARPLGSGLCAFSWYIWRGIYKNARYGKLQNGVILGLQPSSISLKPFTCIGTYKGVLKFRVS